MKTLMSTAKALICFFVVSHTLAQENQNSSVLNQVTDTYNKNMKLNWEMSIGQTNFLNTKTIANRNSTVPQPISFNYYFSISSPVVKDFNRFGAKIGIGPHLKTFGLNKLIEEANNKLIFKDIPDTLYIKASLFQQLLIDLPITLYYDTKANKNNRFLSVEWGVIPGIEANNKWKTYAENNKVVTLKYKEDILGTQKFQFGNCLKISWVKNRGKLSSRLFVQGVFYSTNVFKQALNVTSQNYEIKIGLQITANHLKST